MNEVSAAILDVLTSPFPDAKIETDGNKVFVTSPSREAKARKAVAGSGKLAGSLRAAARRHCGVGSSNSIPVVVVESDQPPKLSGEEPYHTFKNGGVCKFPGAARAKGYKTVYHTDTREITVGVRWLATLIKK